jgi:hypothetical protein
MKEKLNTLETSIKTLDSKVRNCTECPLIVEIKREIQKEQSYIDAMKSQLSA